MEKKDFIFVSEYPVSNYKCGLQAGDRVRLKKNLIIRDHKNRPTGEVHPAGEIWTVLRGSNVGRIDVWFREPNGHSHTWADDLDQISEWFEVIKDGLDPAPVKCRENE